MPHYRIEITSSDGAIDRPDPEGITLDHIGHAKALAVETLLEAAKERVPPGRSRTIAVTAYDERGAAVYGDEATIQGPAASAETEGVWRAMAAMTKPTDPRMG